MERKRKVQKAAISGAGFILMLILCIICIKEVLGAAVNEAATGSTASIGTATEAVAAEGLATGGTATAAVATCGKAEATSQLPVSITYLVENRIEISEEEVQNSIEYAEGKLDYLDEESVSYASQSIQDVVLEYVSAAESDAVDRVIYAGYCDVSILTTEESYCLLATNNYSQESFNKKYNSVYGTNYTGTCAETASVSAIEYYYRKGYGGTKGHSDRQLIFNRVLNQAIQCGAYPAKGNKGGTYNKKLRTAISGYYDYYKVNLDGNYDSSFLRSTVQKSINNKVKPVIGHFHAPNGEGHDMCINGYYDITVCYKKTRKSTTYSSVTYRYYRVNNGWFYAPSSDSSMTDERLQYIREEYLISITKIV